MIDYLVAFTNEAAAITDPTVGAYRIPAADGSPSQWRGDVCAPGIFVWSPANDVHGTDGDGNPNVTHTPYDTQLRMIISLPTQDAALSASAAVELVADREAAAAGRPFLLQANLTADQLGSLALSPIIAGMEVYPFGNAALI